MSLFVSLWERSWRGWNWYWMGRYWNVVTMTWEQCICVVILWEVHNRNQWIDYLFWSLFHTLTDDWLWCFQNLALPDTTQFGELLLFRKDTIIVFHMRCICCFRGNICTCISWSYGCRRNNCTTYSSPLESQDVFKFDYFIIAIYCSSLLTLAYSTESEVIELPSKWSKGCMIKISR